jgi:hypothetical protein
MPDSSAVRPGRLILVPALITLAVTLLRLAGELLHWSKTLFNPAAGGGGALVGISWLPFLFGIYFALRLVGAGERPGSVGRALGLVVLALAIVPVLGFVAVKAGMNPQSLNIFLVYVVGAIAAVPVAMRAWPALGRVLLSYAFAARIPVAVVMLFAILGNWGTHYDVPPPDFPQMGALARWAWIGLLPQMTIWIAYTVVIGALFGVIAAGLAGRKKRAEAAA